ncbi:PKD domain-containing protein [Salinirubrum litoreum]|uniref:Dockerin type I domain-containing protein n=1 Tax=Salinirubrum litoreum TaxID=1126234 RepID=A0ABD5RFM8_9EURY|nr:dockerin type I domain-containing protein [Salinirubrum litoreum]
MNSTTPSNRKALTLLLVTVVALSATVGFAGFAGAATTTDLTVSVTDDDNTIEPGETTTVEIAVASADGGVGAAELGVTSSDPGVAAITDVTVLNEPGSTDNDVAGGGGSADVKYAFADSPDTGSVTVLEVTLQAASAGTTDIEIVENAQTGNLVVFDENGAGYTLDSVGSATLTVNTQPVAVADADPETVTEGETVTLDASASNDPDQGDSLSYQWSQTGGPDVTLSDATAVQPTFTAPDVDSETTLEFALTVTDSFGETAIQSTSVTVQPPEAKETTVSLKPGEQTATVGAERTYDVVVDSAAGGVGAADIAVSVDDSSIATITDVTVLNGANSEDVTIADSTAEFEYFGADTAQTGPVTVATVTVEGAGEGTAGLSIGAADGNEDVLVFDEQGVPYEVTGTTGASLEVQPVQFVVDGTSAPAKAAVGSTTTVTATISSDGAVESTQTVDLQFDLDDDGTAETVDSQQVTVAANGQTQVTFEVDVPADAAFGERGYTVETASDSAGGTVEVTPPAVNDAQDLPGDPDGDGLYEDVNGDGNLNTGDAQSLFSNRDADAVTTNVDAFDFNGDGSVDVGDAQALFTELTGAA